MRSTDSPLGNEAPAQPPWKVLLVDGDEARQSALQQALGSLRFQGRPLVLLRAADAAEAIALLADTPDVAVLLLEAGLQADRTGPDLVHHVRHRLRQAALRILLCGAHAGQAAEHELLGNAEINGMLAPDTGGPARCLVGLLAALRSYAEVRALQQSIDLLHARSVTDQLTGLHNASALRPALARALGSSRRRGESLTVLFLDVDDFKLINDQQGHLRGDEVLRAVGAALLAHSRAEDSCFRYGGDEFLVMLPRCSLAQMALNYLPRLLGAFAQLGLRVSHGAADAGPLHYPTVDELIRTADERMYRHKRAQREARAAAPTVA